MVPIRSFGVIKEPNPNPWHQTRRSVIGSLRTTCWVKTTLTVLWYVTQPFRVQNWVFYFLSADPRTRAFLTHGGTNGLYEAVYHAVPLVGVPLFADQPENLARLQYRGAAIVLDIHSMTSDELTDALNAVVNEPR